MSDSRNHHRREFWITNASKMNVCLSDLRLYVPPGKSMNLLDSKHFHYTLEQLLASQANGSLHAKRDRIFVRDVPPPAMVKPGLYKSDQFLYRAPRSNIKVEDKNYEELNVSDQKFADEMTEDEGVSLPDPKILPNK